MNAAALVVFAVVATAPLFIAIRRPAEAISFPTVSSVIWTVYVLPQAIGIFLNPQYIPAEVYDAGFAATMGMSSLCAVLGYLGWWLGRNPNPTRVIRVLDDSRTLWAGMILGALGLLFAIQISSLSGGVIRHFSVEGSYQLDWYGEEVIYAFLSNTLIFAGVTLVLFSLTKRFSVPRLAALLILISWPVALVIFLARRSPAIKLGIIVVLGLYLFRGWRPSRPQIAAGILVGAVVVFVFPKVRDYTPIGGAYERALAVDVSDVVLRGVLLGGDHKELNNSIGLVAASREAGKYFKGAQHWNSWVQTSVPRTLVGSELKEALKYPVPSGLEFVGAIYGWTLHPYMSTIAPARLFNDFWYFGSLVFVVLGYSLRWVYNKAIRNDQAYMLWYVLLMVYVPHIIPTGFIKIPRQVLALVVFVGPLVLIAQGKVRKVDLKAGGASEYDADLGLLSVE